MSMQNSLLNMCKIQQQQLCYSWNVKQGNSRIQMTSKQQHTRLKQAGHKMNNEVTDLKRGRVRKVRVCVCNCHTVGTGLPYGGKNTSPHCVNRWNLGWRLRVKFRRVVAMIMVWYQSPGDECKCLLENPWLLNAPHYSSSFFNKKNMHHHSYPLIPSSVCLKMRVLVRASRVTVFNHPCACVS